MPTLYGKSLEYIEQTMQEYKSDNRPSTMMHRIAKGYTLEEIRLISKYFSILYTGKSIQ
jgi:cytochrome c553